MSGQVNTIQQTTWFLADSSWLYKTASTQLRPLSYICAMRRERLKVNSLWLLALGC